MLLCFPVILFFLSTEAKIWRVNNNIGVAADFTNVNSAVNNASVLNGDTIHVEPSATIYTDVTLSKRLVFIGNGYFLSGAGANAGLQYNTESSTITFINFYSGSEGSEFYGISFVSPYSYAFGNQIGGTSLNLLFEKCYLYNPYFFAGVSSEYRDLTFRKCYLVTVGIFQGNPSILENIVFENNLLHGFYGSFNVVATDIASSNNIIIRNNTLHTGGTLNATKAYIANNLINSGSCSFNNCVVENNIFSAAQTGITVGPLSSNGNNLINVSWSSLFVVSGSSDGSYQLGVGSPAIGGGVDISGYKPDCGAFGGPDPYKLSGIPAVPSIYALSLGTSSVPVATPSVTATISTRNNN